MELVFTNVNRSDQDQGDLMEDNGAGLLAIGGYRIDVSTEDGTDLDRTVSSDSYSPDI